MTFECEEMCKASQSGKAAILLLMGLLGMRCWALSPDQKVLLDFKESQRNCPEYDETVFSSWNASAAASDWIRVMFEKNGAVTGLQLQYSSICGTLPDAWSKLGNLSTLDLSSNYLTGTLPESWRELGNLKTLYLFDNPNLTGTLPEAWSKLVGVTTWHLHSNNLTGTLPESWSKLGNMQSLVLSNNPNLTGTLPESWSKLVGVAFLSLHGNNLTGTLPEAWSKLGNLKTLYLSNNPNLTGTLPEAWSKLVGAETLALHSNNLTGTLPESWSKLGNLRELELHSNNLNGPLPESWSKLVGVTTLYLNSNNLTGTLPESWSKLGKLWELALYSNNLNGPLLESWSELGSLRYLLLHNNTLTGSLPEAWGTLPLMNLTLSSNNLTGSLPQGWINLDSLMALDVSSNNLTGSLPDSWSKLFRLKFLTLSNNNLNGTLPESWSEWEGLRRLYLSSNHLTGSLPESWSKLYSLDTLILSSNKLTGPMPEAWITSAVESKLSTLNVSSNRLTGAFPRTPPSATVLDVSHNSLGGNISSIDNYVIILNLSDNQLTGAIPDITSTTLLYLDLSHNQLQKLPQVFDAPNATFFSIANNHLAGTIPEYSNHSLAYCDLSNNQLSGTIPHDWTLRDWVFLSLHHNELSAQLPEVWQGKFSVLLLHNNSIHGCLPQAWLHNDSTSILSLSNNDLSCTLPVSYAGITAFKNLDAIYVDGNGFAGVVPLDWMDTGSFRKGDRKRNQNATILYLGDMWQRSAKSSQRLSNLVSFSSQQNWRKTVCLSADLNVRLNGLSNGTIPDLVRAQLQTRLDTAVVPVNEELENRGRERILVHLPATTLQLSSKPQPSADAICQNPRAKAIVAIQWGIVGFLLVVMGGLYLAESRLQLLSRRRPMHAVLSLWIAEHVAWLLPLGATVAKLGGIVIYWFDVGTDINLLRQVYASGQKSLWAFWVLLSILLLHYVVGAAVLCWHFVARRRYLLVGSLLLVPVMPLVDTLAALMTAANLQQRRFVAAFVDWEAVFELRHALEFLLESLPNAVLQTVIYVVGNKPGIGAYLDDWTYVLSAIGTCGQILGMAGLVLWRAAAQHKSPAGVLRSMLTLPRRTMDDGDEGAGEVTNGMENL